MCIRDSLLLALWSGRGATPLPIQPGHGHGGDAALFLAVTNRVASGEPYYRSMRDELVSRQYPTASVFNWRTPLYLEALAHARLAARGVALFLAFGLVIATGLYLRGRGPVVAILAM